MRRRMENARWTAVGILFEGAGEGRAVAGIIGKDRIVDALADAFEIFSR